MERKLAAILAADVVGYTALMERDEAGTFDRVKAHRVELFEPEIARHHGHVFKLMGDGLLAEFASVVDAVECAVAALRGMAERNAAVPDDQRIHVRIGINLGEVIVEGEDRYGDGVNVAARLEQLAAPDSICVSGKVAKEVENKLAFGFEPLGNQKIKNIAEPIAVYRVTLDGGARRPVLRRWKMGPAVWGAAAGVAVAVIAVGAWFTVLRPGTGSIPVASDPVPSIAVLPFDNMSGDETMSYFGDGVSEDIISMLARSPGLSVIARNSSFVYKGKAVDVRQVGRELGVDYVLEGSVRREGDKVRIVAQLINSSDGEHVWAERFDDTGTDPWALQDAVTAKIIAALAGERGQVKRDQYREAWGKDTTNLEEYDYYLRGHDLFMQWRQDLHEESGRVWREGLAKFPDSALLQIKLGFYYYMRAWNGWSDTPEADYQRGGELARQAFAHETLSPLERRLGHWLFAYVCLRERDFERAVREAEAAIALAPYDAFLIGDLGNILISAGRPAQAIEWLDAAAAKDPANAPYYAVTRGWALTVVGKNEESLVTLRDAAMNWVNTPILRAIDLVRLGRIDEAKVEVGKALEIDPAVTQAKWRAMVFYSDPSISDREIADLAAAGLPEK
jgi:TolB-like protein/class 3 adenylate cyclase/Tfp pilus assembly protein PilF